MQGRLGWSAEGLQERWAGSVGGSRKQAKRLLKQGARSNTACPAARPLQVIPAAPTAAAAAPESHVGSKYKGYQEKLRRHQSSERAGEAAQGRGWSALSMPWLGAASTSGPTHMRISAEQPSMPLLLPHAVCAERMSEAEDPTLWNSPGRSPRKVSFA